MLLIKLLLMTPFVWSVTDDLTMLREQSREIVKVVTCGGCHTPGLATTNKKALKIYNLAAPYWSATMSDRQLQSFASRIKTQTTTEEMKELHLERGAGVPTPEQVQIVTQYIDKELRNRRQDPTLRFRQLQETQFPDFYKLFSGFL